MALPTETEIKDIYNPQDPDKALTQIEDSALSSDDRLPVVDAANGNLYNASIKQVTKALDKQSLVIKLDGVVVYDSSPADTVYIEKDSRIQINNGNTIRISTDAPWSGVGTKLLVMASGGTATIAIGSAEQGGKSYTIPDQKYIELIYSVGGWTFYSQMVSLTLAEYEALGDVVNSDNVIYCITDDQASMLSSPTVSSIYVQNGARIDGGLTVNGGASIGGDVSVSGALNVNGENLVVAMNVALSNKVTTLSVVLVGLETYDFPIGDAPFKSLFITGWVSGVGAVVDVITYFSDNEGTSISLNGQNNLQYDLSRTGYIRITNPHSDWRHFRGRIWVS